MTDDPRRLIDDDATSGVLRRDLANARATDPGYDVEAAVARFEASLSAAPGGEIVASGAKRSAVGWIVGGGAVAAAALAWSIGRDPMPVAADRSAPAVAPAPASAPAHVDEPIVPPPPTASPPAPAIAADPPAPARKRTMPAPTPPRAPEPKDDDALAREMAATAAAKRALATDPARALELVAEANREFGKSVYAEDREGIAVLALARLGRAAEARTRGEAYLVAHPKGSYADRIRDVLDAGEKP